MTQKTFAIVASNITVIGATSLIVVRPPASAVNIECIEARVGQRGTTTSEQIGIALGFKASAYQTVVAATPQPLREGGTASVITGGTAVAAGTCGINASAEGAGTFTPVIVDAVDNINGWLWLPTEACRIVVPSGSSQALTLKLLNTPTGLSGWEATLVFREV